MESISDNVRKDFFCLILAGGKGKRLWPKSRTSMPKQFIDFFGVGRTLVQQTYDRYRKFLLPENIYVSTSKEYIRMLKEQLPELDDEHILCEPIHRNTAPIAAWATHRVENITRQGVIIISPADQHIIGEEQFEEDVLNAMSHAKDHKCFLTMGIRPTRPEPGYGYIQLGECFDSSAEDIHCVRSFTEKPEREFAEIFMQSGEFLWNTGLFISAVGTFHERFSRLLPPVMRGLDATMPGASWEQENDWVEENFSTYPNLSLESGILERTENVCVKECHFGWADIGTWHGIYDAFSCGGSDNVVLDTETALTDTKGCVISLPKGRMAVVNGLKDFIVVENDDVLLITPRTDNSDAVVKQLMRYYIDKNI